MLISQIDGPHAQWYAAVLLASLALSFSLLLGEDFRDLVVVLLFFCFGHVTRIAIPVLIVCGVHPFVVDEQVIGFCAYVVLWSILVVSCGCSLYAGPLGGGLRCLQHIFSVEK